MSVTGDVFALLVEGVLCLYNAVPLAVMGSQEVVFVWTFDVIYLVGDCVCLCV